MDTHVPHQGAQPDQKQGPLADDALLIGNLDRKQVEDRLRESEELIRLLNENVHDYAIMIMDPQGRVVNWNSGAERIFGYSAAEMLGHDTTRIFTPEDIARGVPQQELRTALAEGRAEDERWHVGKGGNRFWMSGVMMPLRDQEGRLRGFSKVARDQTQRVQMEEALRASEERLRLALDAAEMGAWDWDIGIDKVTGTEQFYRLLGAQSDEAAKNYATFEERIHPEDREFVRQEVTRSIEEDSPYRAEFRVVWPDGSVHWLASQGQVVREPATGKALRMSGVATDITARKAAETELRRARDELEIRVQERTHELAEANLALQRESAERAQAEEARREALRQLVMIEEEERKRISRELHDQMGQQLTALLLGLQSLKDSSHGRKLALETLEQLQRIADDMGREVHQLALRLRPTALDDLGLPATLANYAAEWSQQTKVEVDFHSRGLDGARLPPAIETTIYRVVQEALNNVAKHAQARRVSLILERHADHVLAIVEDDGVGFDAEAMVNAPDRRPRLGVLGMQERVSQVGGTFTIESTPGGGTSVFVRIPLSVAANGGS